MTAMLSVVLPNYNHGRFIGRALEALLAQEHVPDEIIIIDDGSTDDSMCVIEQFAAKTASMRVLRNPKNMGVIATLERGLRAARGRYIYFAAADDWVLPGFFERAIRSLEAAPDAGLFCGETVLVDSSRNRLYAVRPSVRPAMSHAYIDRRRCQRLLSAIDNWILTCSAVFRRECVLLAGGFNERLGSFADGFIARKIALRFGFIFEPKLMAVWFVSRDSYSRATAVNLQKAKELLDTVPLAIAGDPSFPRWYADLFRNRWRFAVCRLALGERSIDRTFLLTMGARTAAEQSELRRLLDYSSGRLGKLTVLAWLWYRLRPVNIWFFLRTAIRFRAWRLATATRLGLFKVNGLGRRIDAIRAQGVAPIDPDQMQLFASNGPAARPNDSRSDLNMAAIDDIDDQFYRNDAAVQSISAIKAL